MGFPGDSEGKESSCNAGVLGSIPGLGRSPREEKGYPLQYSGLEKSMDSIVHGVTKSQTRVSNFHFTAHFTSSCLSNDSSAKLFEASLDFEVESLLSLMEQHTVGIVL